MVDGGKGKVEVHHGGSVMPSKSPKSEFTSFCIEKCEYFKIQIDKIADGLHKMPINEMPSKNELVAASADAVEKLLKCKAYFNMSAKKPTSEAERLNVLKVSKYVCKVVGGFSTKFDDFTGDFVKHLKAFDEEFDKKKQENVHTTDFVAMYRRQNALMKLVPTIQKMFAISHGINRERAKFNRKVSVFEMKSKGGDAFLKTIDQQNLGASPATSVKPAPQVQKQPATEVQKADTGEDIYASFIQNLTKMADEFDSAGNKASANRTDEALKAFVQPLENKTIKEHRSEDPVYAALLENLVKMADKADEDGNELERIRIDNLIKSLV